MRHKSTGAALITVLVIVFIVMTIIANLTVTNFRMIKRLENRQIIEQSMAIAYSAVDFGRAGLATSGATSQIDTLQDIWAQPFPQTKILPDIYMSGIVIDEQGKFNINDLVSNGLVNRNALTEFTLLLGYLNIPQSLAYNIAYYMASPPNQGDIMQQYIMSKPAYRPAGRPLVDLSELILVKGVTPQICQKLAQYVTAVPVNGAGLNPESAESAVTNPNIFTESAGYGLTVNVNTASAEVIAAKSGISLPMAQRMISARLTQPFQSNSAVSKFLSSSGVNTAGKFPGSTTMQLNIAGLAVNSSYFTVHAVIDDQDDQYRWVAYVFRQNRSGQWPQILWQHPE